MKLCFELRRHFYRHAGNRVSSVNCVNCRVEGKTGLITGWVEFVRLSFNFVRNKFRSKLHWRVFRFAVELVL